MLGLAFGTAVLDFEDSPVPHGGFESAAWFSPSASAQLVIKAGR